MPAKKKESSKRKTKKVNRSKIVSLRHAVYEDKFIIERADGTKQVVSRHSNPSKYNYYLRTYGYSYP